MKILSVFDPSFRNYGQVIPGYDTAELTKALNEKTPLPETGVTYVAECPDLMALPIAKTLSVNAFGGMPVELGYCNGHNTALNCLEYHRDSEFNFGTEDFILLLAKREEIEPDFTLDTDKVVAYKCPANTLIEVYANTLHYAPCSAAKGAGFKVLVVLPKGTNGPKPELPILNTEDKLLFAANKWLLAHPDAGEVKDGAWVGLKGVNTDIAADI